MFPSDLAPDVPAPAEFALQFWEPQKTTNVGILVGILGLLVGNKGKPVSRLYCSLVNILDLVL